MTVCRDSDSDSCVWVCGTSRGVGTRNTQKKAVGQDTIKFLYDGHRLQNTQSPSELEMEDGDVIDAVIEQVGGQSS